MFIDFRERRKGERETSMWKKNIDQMPPICTPTKDGTHNLTGNRTHNTLVHGAMLQPTESPNNAALLYFEYNDLC